MVKFTQMRRTLVSRGNLRWRQSKSYSIFTMLLTLFACCCRCFVRHLIESRFWIHFTGKLPIIIIASGSFAISLLIIAICFAICCCIRGSKKRQLPPADIIPKVWLFEYFEEKSTLFSSTILCNCFVEILHRFSFSFVLLFFLVFS